MRREGPPSEVGDGSKRASNISRISQLGYMRRANTRSKGNECRNERNSIASRRHEMWNLLRAQIIENSEVILSTSAFLLE